MAPFFLDAMDKPAHNNDDLSKLSEKLIKAQWDENLNVAFKTLNTNKESAAIKEKLLAENKHVLFWLGNQLEKEVVETALDKIPAINERFTLKEHHQSSLFFRLFNSVRFIALDNVGNYCACVNVNNELFYIEITKPIVQSGTIFTGREICGIAHLEKPRSILVAKIDGFGIIDCLSQENKPLSFKPIFKCKKALLSPNGKSLLLENINNEKALVSGLLQKVTEKQINNLNNQTCLAIDAKEEKGLIGTSEYLLLFTRKENIHEARKCEKNMQNIFAVDITDSGEYGLAVNNLGFARINLEKEDGNIEVYSKEITCGRISNCGNYIVTGNANGQIHLYPFPFSTDTRINLNPTVNKEVITAVAFSGDGNTIAAGTDESLYIFSCKKAFETLSRAPTSKIAALFRCYYDKNALKNDAIKQDFKALTLYNKIKLLNRVNPKDIEDDREFTCEVCLETIVNYTTSCGHELCKPCFEKLLKESPTCPYCRQSLHQKP